MIFEIDDLTVFFPYDYIYPEQYKYMVELKRAIDSKGHCVVEMPSGTGKTVSLLSLIVSYHLQFPDDVAKLIYCSRTIPEIEKVIAELKKLIQYIATSKSSFLNKRSLLGVVLSSRKNLCIHPVASTLKDGRLLDSKCHSLTATSVLARHKADPDGVPICNFFDGFSKLPRNRLPPGIETTGVYNLDDLKTLGEQTGCCPYYLARRMLLSAQIIVYSYHYLIDPKIAAIVSKDFSKKCVVVFDEAHNIDNVCIESMSISLRKANVESCCQILDKLKERVAEQKDDDRAKLHAEYEVLLDGLRRKNQNDVVPTTPVLPKDIVDEAMPGSIRKAEHFINFMKRFAEYLKCRLRSQHVIIETPALMLKDLQIKACIERKPLKFCHDRLIHLLESLEITDDLHSLTGLFKVAAFATLVSTYLRGFVIFVEPFDDYAPTVRNPVLHLACLDPSIAMKPIFDRFQSVIVTSGTLSPLEMYPKMLGFRPAVIASFTMTLARQCLLPMVVTRGADQVAISSKFDVRDDVAVIRNYGILVTELARIVPDGMIVFFTSYVYLESVIGAWYEQGVFNNLLKHKLVFVETRDSAETSVALRNYRLACDNGRGAILLSVARGKVSEGVDFDFHYGRCVIMLGVPYIYTQSRLLRARLDFLRQECAIREADFLTFDAVRQASQCIGRAIRGKSDYGVMILADKRYSRNDKRSRLPAWIQNCLTDSLADMSTDEAVHLVRKFYRLMAQPFTKEDQLGISLLNYKQLMDFATQYRYGDTAGNSNGEVQGMDQ